MWAEFGLPPICGHWSACPQPHEVGHLLNDCMGCLGRECEHPVKGGFQRRYRSCATTSLATSSAMPDAPQQQPPIRAEPRRPARRRQRFGATMCSQVLDRGQVALDSDRMQGDLWRGGQRRPTGLGPGLNAQGPDNRQAEGEPRARAAAAALAVAGLLRCGCCGSADDGRRNKNDFRGRDASYLAPPAQIRTCGFPAYGSHLG